MANESLHKSCQTIHSEVTKPTNQIIYHHNGTNPSTQTKHPQVDLLVESYTT